MQAQTEAALAADRPVIYAVEEPEAAQHPDKQRALLRALQELSQQRYSQVAITTHTPMLARLLPVESLRYIELDQEGQRFIHVGDETTNELVAKALGVLPDHSVRLFIGVEGANDISFLKAVSAMLREHGEEAPDLEALEADGAVVFVPVGGSNLALWTSRLQRLQVEEFHIYDRDVEPPHQPKYQEHVDELNARDRCQAVVTNKREIENYLRPAAISAVYPEVDIEFEDFEDVPELVAERVHAASESQNDWEDVPSERKDRKVGSVKKRLNRDAARKMTPQMLDDRDPQGEARGWLARIDSLISD